jgi:hypothetical protein
MIYCDAEEVGAHDLLLHPPPGLGNSRRPPPVFFFWWLCMCVSLKMCSLRCVLSAYQESLNLRMQKVDAERK